MILNNRLCWLVLRSCKQLYLIISVNQRRPFDFRAWHCCSSTSDLIRHIQQTTPNLVTSAFLSRCQLKFFSSFWPVLTSLSPSRHVLCVKEKQHASYTETLDRGHCKRKAFRMSDAEMSDHKPSHLCAKSSPSSLCINSTFILFRGRVAVPFLSSA